MKVSKEQKIEHQQRFIQAFISEVREQGYAAVSLRDVARRSGMSDGAIYKHFASKEKILLAYYLLKMEGLRKEGAVLLGRKGYTLQERLQALLEFQIGQYEGEKDFLEKTFHATFVAASLMWSEVAAMRRMYLETAGAFIKASEADGEIPELVWAGIVDEMLWCHYMGVMMYWLKDGSESHEDTTQFMDRTVNLFTAVVGGPLLKQAEELVGFLVNRHLMPLLMNLGSFGGSKAGYGAKPPPKREPAAGSRMDAKSKANPKPTHKSKIDRKAILKTNPNSNSKAKGADRGRA
ncbi:MAG: TetR/AcrR family transcriptional regulator [Fibrobacteria bacterium]